MRAILAALVMCGSLGCAVAPILPNVDAGFSAVGPAVAAKRLLPSEPKAQWHVAPTEQGAALELRF